MKNEFSHSDLKKELLYSPETGRFVRLTKRKGSNIGDQVGSVTSGGYLRVRVFGRQYLAHRLAWFYVTGEWPKHSIDHIDCNPKNNRFENLRDVPIHTNQQNRRYAQKNNKTSGVLGVCRNRNRKKWRASIKVMGKTIYLGSFDTPEQAKSAYVLAKRKFHPGCTV